MDDDAQRKLVNNERLKLLVTFVNGMGIAVFAVGVLAPIVASASRSDSFGGAAALTTIFCFSGAFILHYLASTILKGLQP